MLFSIKYLKDCEQIPNTLIHETIVIEAPTWFLAREYARSTYNDKFVDICGVGNEDGPAKILLKTPQIAGGGMYKVEEL